MVRKKSFQDLHCYTRNTLNSQVDRAGTIIRVSGNAITFRNGKEAIGEVNDKPPKTFKR